GDRHGRAGGMKYAWAVAGVKCTPVNDDPYFLEDGEGSDGPAMGQIVTISHVMADADGVWLRFIAWSATDWFDASDFRPLIERTQEQDVALFAHHLAQNGIQTSSPEPVA